MIALLMTVTMAGVLVILSGCGSDDSEAKQPLDFEVSEIGPRFVFDETPLNDDGLPAYGNEFVTQGYIYPAGTLDLDDGVDGVNADGSAEFPDKVLGIWTCSGWHVGEGATSEGQPWVVTTQIYALDGPTDQDQKGETTIVTNGYELPDIDADVHRAIIGGTGEHEKARGEQVQRLLGFNESEGVIMSVQINVRN